MPEPVRLALALLLAAAIAVPASARMHAPYRGHRIIPANAGVLDGFTAPAAAYSFRKLRTAYAGSAVKLRRTTGGTQDIGFVGNDFDTATAATFCAATTCFLDTWYDQSGNARHLVQATAANQPQYIANCNGSLPCARALSASTVLLMAGTVTPAMPVSLSTVAHRNVTSGNACYLLSMASAAPHNQIITPAAANSWQLFGASGSIIATAADGAWHAAEGVVNGASSVFNIDGAETAGTITGSVVAGGFNAQNNPAASSQCSQTEAVVWNGYALTGAERTALQQNQRNYWMPLPLDTFAAPSGAYSLRKLKSSYAGPAIRLRRASDNAEQDIGFLGFTGFTGAPIDTAAANAFCASTTCFVRTLYDQSGNTRHLAQVTTAIQPAFLANCGDGLPCVRVTNTQQVELTVALPIGASMTLNAVARQTTRPTPGGFLSCYFAGAGQQQIVPHADYDILYIVDGTHNINPAGWTALNWHSLTGVFAPGVAGVGLVDANAETVGTMNVIGGTNLYVAAGNETPGNVCDEREFIVWFSASTSGERAALHANQKSFWSIP